MGPGGFNPNKLRKALKKLDKDMIKQAQDHAKNINYITLMVDSSKITQEEIDEHCHFVHLSHKGKPTWVQESGSNEKYTLKVLPKDKIIWTGISTTENPKSDTIGITKIDYESGQNLFGSKDLKDEMGNGTVMGVVRDDVSEVDAMEYTIKFEVYNGNKLRGKYSIDPKISIKPKQ